VYVSRAIVSQGVAAHLVMRGPFMKDVPNLFGAAPKAGERWQLDGVMFYTLRDGRISELNPGPLLFTRRL